MTSACVEMIVHCVHGITKTVFVNSLTHLVNHPSVQKIILFSFILYPDTLVSTGLNFVSSPFFSVRRFEIRCSAMTPIQF